MPNLPSWFKSILLLVSATVLLSACEQKEPTPEEIRAELVQLLPAYVKDRDGWANDIQHAFASLKIKATPENLCAVLAVTEQESGFVANPEVPGLGTIALKEIKARAARLHVPEFAVQFALEFKSPDGQSWETRIAQSRTEKQLSDIFEEMIATVPLGKRFLSRANPVHTGGPMQVSIAYAESHARRREYPYATPDSIRHEVFNRRGGMYFGIAHLLDYPVSYDKPLFRFADYNAGHYASRNAAFQNAVAVATGIPLALDGDLVRYGKTGKKAGPGASESAALGMASQLGMTPEQIHADLLASNQRGFESTELYRRVFEIADQRNGRALPRATLPRIRLESPKITRKLTTEWFATRVNRRYLTCMDRTN